jgi:sigma-E factor negative regulatory protein RseC
MIEEEAIVISKNGEFAEVDIIRTKPCGLCGKTQGCGNYFIKIYNSSKSF